MKKKLDEKSDKESDEDTLGAIDTTDMPDLESEQSAAQEKQVAKGLKIHQTKCRLPVCLAELKAGNNSEKLKNEIRQLLYSLCRSKKFTKQLYKSLVHII